ncbi:MAG: hypothetical protein GXP16_18865 [Gammaproteobacteria bacterium]|nr:hypothetical protein [Gammaproteobacteria bacterium]
MGGVITSDLVALFFVLLELNICLLLEVVPADAFRSLVSGGFEDVLVVSFWAPVCLEVFDVFDVVTGSVFFPGAACALVAACTETKVNSRQQQKPSKPVLEIFCPYFIN